MAHFQTYALRGVVLGLILNLCAGALARPGGGQDYSKPSPQPTSVESEREHEREREHEHEPRPDVTSELILLLTALPLLVDACAPTRS